MLSEDIISNIPWILVAREVIISERSAPKAIVERRHGEPIKFQC